MQANSNVTLSPDAYVRVVLDTGEEALCKNLQTKGSLIELDVPVDADLLDKATSATLVFGEGSFVLLGGKVSPEIAVAVPIGGLPLTGTGELSGSWYQGQAISLTEVLEVPDGSRFFYQCEHAMPFVGERTYYKNVIDPDDPTKVTRVLLEGDEAQAAREEFRSKSFMADESPADRAAQLVPKAADLGKYQRLLDATVYKDTVYVLSKSWDDGEACLFAFAQDGSPLTTYELGTTAYNYGRVVVGPTGKLAVTLYAPFFSELQPEVTRFFDARLGYIGVLQTNGNCCARWLDDGRYITYGWRYDRRFAGGHPSTTRGLPWATTSCSSPRKTIPSTPWVPWTQSTLRTPWIRWVPTSPIAPMLRWGPTIPPALANPPTASPKMVPVLPRCPRREMTLAR